jgi:hypothetical protein
MKMARLAILGGIMLVVAGCGAFGGDNRRLPCPNFLLLGNAENMTRFQAGPGRDITDIEFRAAITNFHGTCVHAASEVETEFFVEFAIQRGPANRSRQATFEFFVAIPRFHPAPAGKKTFSGTVTFGENQTRVFYRDQITLTIPLKSGETGASYDVYLGFQLDAEQLQYNMRRKAR